jgi:hypothetical protein
MKMAHKIRDRFVALSLVATLIGAAPAQADYRVLDATAVLTPFKAFSCTGIYGVSVCPGYVPMDYLGSAFGIAGNPFYVAPVQDLRPSATTITAQDTASSSAAGQNSVAIITGTPTTNSVSTQAINGQAIARVQLAGTWTGNVAFEGSVDNGNTWVAQPARVTGTSYTGSSATLNGMFLIDTSGLTNIRVRSTAAMTGSVSVTFTFANNAGAVQVINPIRIFDQVSGQLVTVKPANIQPTEADTGVVTADRGVSGTPAMTTATVGTSSGQLVAAAAYANFLKVCVPVTAANGIWVRWDGGTAAAASPAEYMPPGQCDSWVRSTGFMPTGQINAIASASVAVSVNGN